RAACCISVLRRRTPRRQSTRRRRRVSSIGNACSGLGPWPTPIYVLGPAVAITNPKISDEFPAMSTSYGRAARRRTGGGGGGGAVLGPYTRRPYRSATTIFAPALSICIGDSATRPLSTIVRAARSAGTGASSVQPRPPYPAAA